MNALSGIAVDWAETIKQADRWMMGLKSSFKCIINIDGVITTTTASFVCLFVCSRHFSTFLSNIHLPEGFSFAFSDWVRKYRVRERQFQDYRLHVDQMFMDTDIVLPKSGILSLYWLNAWDPIRANFGTTKFIKSGKYLCNFSVCSHWSRSS